MDDEEFFLHQQYFELDEIRHMISVLNRIVFSMHLGFWGSMTQRWEIFTTLVKQLYDREYLSFYFYRYANVFTSCRRKFCPDNHWILKLPTDEATNKQAFASILQNTPFVIPYSTFQYRKHPDQFM